MWIPPFCNVEMTAGLISIPTTCKPWVANVAAVGRPVYPSPRMQIFFEFHRLSLYWTLIFPEPQVLNCNGRYYLTNVRLFGFLGLWENQKIMRKDG